MEFRPDQIVELASKAAEEEDLAGSEEALQLVWKVLDTERETFEAAMFDLVPVLMLLARASDASQRTFRNVMVKAARTCSPREIIALTLSLLDEAASGWACLASHTCPHPSHMHKHTLA